MEKESERGITQKAACLAPSGFPDLTRKGRIVVLSFLLFSPFDFKSIGVDFCTS